VVDELCLFNPPDEAIRRRLLEQSRQAGAGVVISAFMTRGPLEPGVPRVMFLGREIECGHPNEAWIDWPDEQVQVEPASRLEEPDVLARRRLLTGALKGKVALSDAALVKGVADPDLYVRRLALRTLAKSPRPGTQPPRCAIRKPPCGAWPRWRWPNCPTQGLWQRWSMPPSRTPGCISLRIGR
jgi:hypothetical protein